MIGYHYTTQKTADIILAKGLKPLPLNPQHNDHFAEILSFTTNGVIWLYKELQTGNALLGMIMHVATQHCSNEVCCLEVEYSEDVSVTILAKDSIVRLRHTLNAGCCGHDNQTIDLAIAPIPSEQIKLIGQWDLYDAIKGKER